VVRQLLTESVVLAGIASAIGLALAYVLPDAFARFIGRAIPGNLDVTPDGHVLAYAVGIALASAVAFGLLPALRGTRAGVGEALKRQSSHAGARAPLRGALLALQVAVSVALLMSAGLLVRGLDRARSLDVGFETAGVTAVRVTLPPNTYDLAREAAFYDELVAAAGEPAAVSLLLPLGGRWEATGFDRFGDVSCNTERIVTQRVSRGFFDVLGIPLVAGTTFAAGPLGRNSLVIDESLARACWPGESAVGRVVTFGDTTLEIVGIARDAHLTGVGTVYPTYYAPFVPDGDLVRGPAFVLVRNESAAAAAAAVRRLDAAAVAEVLPLDAEAERSLAGTADIARIASALGLVALVLATVGVYGVVSYSVEQRRRELGIRIALGARPDQVARHVLRANGIAIAIGLAVGLAIAAAASLLLRSRLYGLSPLDPVAYAGVLGLLAIAGAVASIVPARRAARTDPIVTLHED
jgi:predicted permease